MTSVERLQQAKARPMFVEEAVRTALRDAIAWRVGGGRAPRADALISAALSAAQIGLGATAGDASERSRRLAAVQSAAQRFTSSALCRRLMQVPAAQFLRFAPSQSGPDAVVRDRRGRMHAIALTVARDALEAGRCATIIAQATPLLIGDRLTPLRVHVFSLATAQRHMFERDVYFAQNDFHERHDRRDGVRVA